MTEPQESTKTVAPGKLRFAMLAASLLPFLYCGGMTYRYGFDAPYWDQWWHVPLIASAFDGTVQFSDFFRSINEHKVFFPNFLIVGLALATRWDMTREHMTMLLFGALVFVMLTERIARWERDAKRRGSLWAVPILSLLIFSYSQRGIWMWGLHIIIMMPLFCSVASMALLAENERGHTRFLVAAIMAIVASFSFGTALAVWPGGLAILLVRAFKKSGLYQAKRGTSGDGTVPFFETLHTTPYYFTIAAWCLLGAAVAGIYWMGLGDTGAVSTAAEAWKHPLAFCAYVLAYVGGPVAAFSGGLALAAGLAATVISLAVLYRYLKEPGHSDELAALGAGLIIFGLCAGILTGLKQFPEGPAQAISSRYLAWSSLSWAGLLLFGYHHSNTFRGLHRAAKLGVVLLTLGLGASSLYGTYRADERHDAFLIGRQALLEGRTDSDLLYLYPDAEIPREFRAFLVQHRLTVFRAEENGPAQ